MKTKLITAVSLLALGAATQANAADVIMHRHVAPVVVVKPVDTFSWTGFYAGAQGSFQWAKHDIHTGAVNAGAGTISIKKDGAGAGLFAGFNSNLMSGAVLGIETDILWNKIHDHFDQTFNASSPANAADITHAVGDFDEKWSGATRVRVGFAQDKILPFLAGGIAYTSIETHGVALAGGTTPAAIGASGNATIANHKENLVGWTAGAGVDCAVADNLLVRLEYRYNDFGKKHLPLVLGNGTTGPNGVHYEMKHSSHDVRVGVAYKF
ncbi:outer membrane protein [Bartonella sp. TP]|uniref:outer membrane protein n=1 Tax=Bartonella sp. TP TaxID=3057550 RepID=UPI0025B0C4B7|nr:outer membrane protein [Bartonella sp. TP]WJW80366.1 porin family protein [Bartonella sp. TP]